MDEVTIAGNTDLTGALTVNGTSTIDDLVIAGAMDFTGALDVTGTSTFDDVVIAGPLDMTGNMDITGTATFDTVVVLATAGQGFDSDLVPVEDDTHSLGAATYQWKNLYVDGTANLDEVAIVGNVIVGVDGTGHTFTWYSDIASDSMVYSDTTGKLTITGSASGDALDVVDGDVYIQDVLKLGRQTETTTTDSTVTIASSYLEVDGSTGNDIILSATGAKEGDVLFVVNIGTETWELDGDTGTMKVDGGTNVDVSATDGVIFIFDGANWIQMGKIPTNS